jgi:parvulin-like peptidyl-prolyl isomerase
MSAAVHALRWLLFGLASVALLSCRDAATQLRASAARRGATEDGEVVSIVNGVSIHTHEVQRLVAATGLSARTALARLQAERLLELEAAQRGYGSRSETNRVARQALVQALLSRDVEVVSVDEAEITRAYAAARARFEPPEKRVASHVLALVPKGASEAQERAAHAFAEAACRELLASHDRSATLETWKAQAQNSPQLPLKVEDLPAVADDGSFVPEFTRALFSLSEPGVVATPVRTEFGWHAIVLTAIQPSSQVPMAVARAQLRRELATQKHKSRFDALLATLRDRTPVQYADAARQALAGLDF